MQPAAGAAPRAWGCTCSRRVAAPSPRSPPTGPPGLRQPPHLFQNHDLVALRRGGEAVRHQHARAAPGQAEQRAQHLHRGDRGGSRLGPLPCLASGAARRVFTASAHAPLSTERPPRCGSRSLKCTRHRPPSPPACRADGTPQRRPTSFSVRLSNAEVASSHNSTRGDLRKARASATRCFSPPLRATGAGAGRVGVGRGGVGGWCVGKCGWWWWWWVGWEGKGARLCGALEALR